MGQPYGHARLFTSFANQEEEEKREKLALQHHLINHQEGQKTTKCPTGYFCRDYEALASSGIEEKTSPPPLGCKSRYLDQRILNLDRETDDKSRNHSLDGLESQFCYFMSLAVFPNSLLCYSGLHAGLGPLVLGYDYKSRIDLSLVMKMGDVTEIEKEQDEASSLFKNRGLIFFSNFHGSYFHRKPDEKHNWSCYRLAKKQLGLLTHQFALQYIAGLKSSSLKLYENDTLMETSEDESLLDAVKMEREVMTLTLVSDSLALESCNASKWSFSFIY